VTSVIAWNSIDFSLDEQDQIKEVVEEGIEYESSTKEEESEDERVSSIQFFLTGPNKILPILEMTASFHYSFAINVYCKEPEIHPPRC
jgi:hypothetical protein